MTTVSPQHDQIHADLYEKVNACTLAVTTLTTELKTLKAAMTAETDRYVAMLTKQQDRQFRLCGCLFLAVVFCIGIIGYGAIGQKGMYTVRNTAPLGTAALVDTPYIPTNDRDLSPYRNPDKGKD